MRTAISRRGPGSRGADDLAVNDAVLLVSWRSAFRVRNDSADALPASESVASPSGPPPDLEAWASTIVHRAKARAARTFAVGCGAGCLAVLRAASVARGTIAAALLVAPAPANEPAAIARLGIPTIVVGRRTVRALPPPYAAALAHAIGGLYIETDDVASSGLAVGFESTTYGVLLLDRLARTAAIRADFRSPGRPASSRT